ncbi:unnamed protein product [Peronospora belbahrii]|uniref:Uncharacterized protein n=1 Tax=Peronospora belbahrii TaxID=622444 RepID=A0AAU9KQC1_9STRA|nr:unnamed protein product [Peronospora belbahrii]CAH0515458.1 unnamed protein product [Peronospora belbahrii]
MDVGTNVWVKTKDAAVWAAGKVLNYDDVNGVVKIRRLDTGEIVTRYYYYPDTAPHEVCLRNQSVNFGTLSSLTSLEYLHEAALLQALDERFLQDKIYTSIGDILVALNPLKPLPLLYSDTIVNAYKQAMMMTSLSSLSSSSSCHREKELPPHVFAIGGKAFRGLFTPRRRNQSILVSGESGSGKTESTKFLMQFLTNVGREETVGIATSRTSPTTTTGSSTGAVEIGRRILQTNPILESFGNAQTIRNDNSSRFGKFIQLQFGHKNEIIGAEIVSYLLEKVRVVHQSPEESNFHIFYELLEGGESELLERLGLKQGGKYELLNSYGSHQSRRRKTVTENKYAQLYVETIRAFEDIGVQEQERGAIFKILAALLHLGNVNFTALDEEEETSTAVTFESRFHLEKCAELLGVSVNELETLLSSREIMAGGEVMVLKLNPEQAKEICRSLAKAVYGRLFSWLVRRLSDEMNYFDSTGLVSDENEDLATIGILDIFGFESLNCNGFEQLCINYANERLQAQFNEFVFVREQQVYIAEEIDWKNITYPSNAACLALFDDKSSGLFSLLDQECRMPKGSNQALSTKFYRYHGGNRSSDVAGVFQQPQLAQSTLRLPISSFSRYLYKPKFQEERVHQDTKKHTFSASKMERVKYQFVVHHFAGRVCYNVEQFLEKNTDALPADASSILSTSSNEVVVAIGADDNVDSPRVDNRVVGRRRYSMLRAPSVSAQFKSQLDSLIVEIGRTEAHYIRCLKPNELKKPGIFDRERMVEQMRSVGVLEAVRIARHGYSVRLAHASFVELFSGFKRFLNKRDRSTKMNTKDLARALATVLMNKVVVEDSVERKEKPSGVQLFVTEKRSEMAFDNNVSCKDVQVGTTLVFCKASIYNRFSRYRLELQNQSATMLQKHYRRHRCRVLFQELRSFAVHLQAIVRGFLARKRVGRLRELRRENAATCIQSCWKGCMAKRKVAEMLKHKQQVAAVILIQRQLRRFLAQRALARILKDKRQLASALCIQMHCRRWLAQRKLAFLHRQKLRIAAATCIQAQCRRWIAEHKREKLLRMKREHAAACVIQSHCRTWLEQNSCVAAKLRHFRLMMAFGKFRRACLASQAASEVEAEPLPSDGLAASPAKCGVVTLFDDVVTHSSLEQEGSDERMEPRIRISTPVHGRSNSRRRNHASSNHLSDRNSLLEQEILRLQQMLLEQQSRRDDYPAEDQRLRSSINARPPRSAPHEHLNRALDSRLGRRRSSVGGLLSEDEDEEVDDEVSLLPPRRARSVVPGKQVDHVSMLSRKIEELDAKCKFLEQLVARKNYEDAARDSFSYSRGSIGGREGFPSAESFYGSDAGPDVDSLIFSIQNQMNMLRQSIAEKEQVLQTSRISNAMSFSSSTRPTRSSSAASTTSFSNLPMGEAPPSLPSLPLSESQLSAGGSSYANSRRSGGSSLGLPPTPTSSVMSSSCHWPSRPPSVHMGNRSMPRIVKWARSTNCYECEEPFNLFVRRHHCRMCGNSFCHEHSSRRASVFGIGFDDEPVRVCDNCFAEYYASQESHTVQYPRQYSFTSGPMSSSSRFSGS